MNYCIALCLCCLLSFFVTGLSDFLVCILWSCSFFCCFVLIFDFHSSHKMAKKPDTAETQKSKNAEKRDPQKSVSAVVFTNSVPNFWGGLKNANFC